MVDMIMIIWLFLLVSKKFGLEFGQELFKGDLSMHYYSHHQQQLEKD